MIAANQDPRLAGVFTTFSASTPSVFLDIDRDKAQILKVEPAAIFQALQNTARAQSRSDRIVAYLQMRGNFHLLCERFPFEIIALVDTELTQFSQDVMKAVARFHRQDAFLRIQHKTFVGEGLVLLPE
mgnify:CR=1 FL=1